MSLDGIPEFLKPRLRVFLSVDLVGSTALKQSGEFPIEKPNGSPELHEVGAKWIFELASFYREIEARVAKAWAEYVNSTADSQRWPRGEAPRLWKANGDELIYVKEVASSRECIALIACWKNACTEYRADLKRKKSKLDVKMAAWTAGFPISNTEVVFERDPVEVSEELPPEILHYKLYEEWHSDPKRKDALIQDFIGPSIDTGFRIASKATPRKFTICLELALILTTIRIPAAIGSLPIRYDGQEVLKGVLANKPYPVFWINTHTEDALACAEDRLINNDDLSPERVHAFCEAFLKDHGTYLLKPFIYGDSESSLNGIPEYYSDKIRQIAEVWERAKVSQSVRLRSISEAQAPGDTQENTISADIELTLPPPTMKQGEGAGLAIQTE